MVDDRLLADASNDPTSVTACEAFWNELSSVGRWLSPRPCWGARNSFGRISAAGQALLAKVRAECVVASETEYKDLIAFNDRYTGVEAFERAYGAYRQACADDEIAGMLHERPTFLKQLETAKARKEFLTQQSAQIATNQQRLDDDTAAVQHEGLANFMDDQTQIAIADLKTRLRQLHEIAPAKRRDISATLGAFATRIGDIDTAIASARAIKNKAEQTQHTLAENEGIAKRILDAATSADLKPAFDEQFVQSVNDLIHRFDELETTELSLLRDRQQDIAGATRQLDELQRRISDAQARYDQATSQSAHITTYQQRLSDIAISIQHEDLPKFINPQTQIAIDESRKELPTAHSNSSRQQRRHNFDYRACCGPHSRH